MDSKERPILFSDAMVRAILAGKKTQTRRVAKLGNNDFEFQHEPEFRVMGLSSNVKCPYGQPGDRLWVRESFAKNLVLPLCDRADGDYIYRAELDEKGGAKYSATWKTPIHMPRSASRILLEITAVRCERLQEISESDAISEGTTPSIVGDNLDYLRYRAGYETLWQSINGAKPGKAWSDNPWVWVIEFRRIEQ
jgi:hypothetical protein